MPPGGFASGWADSGGPLTWAKSHGFTASPSDTASEAPYQLMA